MQAHDRDTASQGDAPSQRRSRTGIFRPRRARTGAQTAITVGLALLVFIVAFVHYRSEVDTTAFHPDESRWINRAHYLEDLLDPFGTTWNDQYLTRGQPPVGSYVMGAGLLAQGKDLDTNRAWDFRRGGDWNVQNGMYPTQEDLRAGRMTNVTLGAIAVVLTFLSVRLLSNSAGGIVAAAILTFHPLQAWHNRLALADTTLTLTLAALVLAIILLLRRPSWFRAIAVGVLIGIGGANKLTPMALAFVLAAAGAALLVWAYLEERRSAPAQERWYHAVPRGQHFSWMLLASPLIAGATFIAVYPYLWKQPLHRTLSLLDFRRNEMDEQARLYPQFAVETPIEAIRKTWESLADRWSASEWLVAQIAPSDLSAWFGPVDLLLALPGTALVAFVAARMPIRSGHLIVLLVLVVQVATIILAMRTDFERYYLPIVLSVAIFAGSGIGIGIDLLRGLIDRDETDATAPDAAGTVSREGASS